MLLTLLHPAAFFDWQRWPCFHSPKATTAPDSRLQIAVVGEAGQDAPAAKKKVVYGKKKAGPKKPSADAEAEAAREAELAAAEEAARKQAEEQRRVEEEQVMMTDAELLVLIVG